MRRPARPERAGFTLIEVLAALAILGLGLMALLQAHYGAVRLYERAHERVTARDLMELALAKAELEVLAGNLSGSGEFNKRYPGRTYTFEAQLMGDETLPFYEVHVTVQGPDEKSTQEMSVFVFDLRI